MDHTKTLDVIIPLTHLDANSLRCRIDSLNYAINNYYHRQSQVNVNVILVEQSLDGKIYYLDNIESPDVTKIEIHYPMFNKGWCMNHGFKASSSPVVMFADGDMFGFEDCFEKMLDWFDEKNARWAFAWDNLYYTEYLEKSKLVYHGSRSIIEEDPKTRRTQPKRGFSEGGLVLFRRDYYKHIGQCNEFMEELGGPDNELAIRARRVCDEAFCFNQYIYHLYHQRTPKSQRPTRAMNMEIHGRVANAVDRAINFLKTYEPAGKVPYCKGKSFLREWTNKMEING